MLDLSFPENNSINDNIVKNEYLGKKTKVIFQKWIIIAKGRGCLLFKKDLHIVYRQISIDPANYNLVAFVLGKHTFVTLFLA